VAKKQGKSAGKGGSAPAGKVSTNVRSGKAQKARSRRPDWEANHNLIKELFYELLRLHKRAPQISEIADRLGLSYRTVERHIEEIDLREVMRESPVRLMTDEVLAGVARAGVNGSAANAKLFFQLMHGWAETMKNEHSGPDGGAIEIDDRIGETRRARAIAALLQRGGAEAGRPDSGPDESVDPERGAAD
jgi:DNA-binding transcriptional ArsR family regulator